MTDLLLFRQMDPDGMKMSTMLFIIVKSIVTDLLLFRLSDPNGMERVDDALKYCVEYCDGFATFLSLGSGWDGNSRRCA